MQNKKEVEQQSDCIQQLACDPIDEIISSVNSHLIESVTSKCSDYITAFKALRYYQRNKCNCGSAIPTFGFLGQKAVCCKICKQEGMLNVKDRLCICGKTPYFGNKQDKVPRFCKNCKDQNMVNLKDKMCSCGKQASFGFQNQGKRTHCKNCKEDSMVNLIYKKKVKQDQPS